MYQYAIEYDPDTQVPKIDYDPAKVRGYTGMSVFFDISWPQPAAGTRELVGASEEKITQMSQQLEDHAAALSRFETLLLTMIGVMIVGILMIIGGALLIFTMMRTSKNAGEKTIITRSEVV